MAVTRPYLPLSRGHLPDAHSLPLRRPAQPYPRYTPGTPPVHPRYTPNTPPIHPEYTPGTPVAPTQASGAAMADLIFGSASPCGKLAETFPLRAEDCASHPHFMNHPSQLIYREGLNVGYRYFQTHARPVLFPFGHGLTYTEFRYSDLALAAASIGQEDSLKLTFDIANVSATQSEPAPPPPTRCAPAPLARGVTPFDPTFRPDVST